MNHSDIFIAYRDQITGHANILKVGMSEFYEIYSYIDGEGPFFYFVNDVMYEMNPGDIIIVRPGVIRGSCKKLKARYRRLYVRFTEEYLETIGELCPKVLQFFANNDIVRLAIPDEAAEEYNDLIEDIRVALERNDEYSKIFSYSFFLRQLVIISRFADSSQNIVDTRNSSESSRMVREVLEYIGENWMRVSSVAEVAESLHYSRNYLSSCFRQKMNIGIREYLLEKKLRESVAMLISGMSVTECAYNCGLGDASYFIRVFKRRYGMTPKKYSEKINR